MNQFYSFYPDKTYARELVRPWKLFSFCVAMSLLFYGALNFGISDWDIGVSIIMGVLTYIIAPWSVNILFSAIRYRPKYWFLHCIVALISSVFVVDWSYMIYHSIMENQTLREANFYASMPLFFLAGTFWLYRGSLKELVRNFKELS